MSEPQTKDAEGGTMNDVDTRQLEMFWRFAQDWEEWILNYQQEYEALLCQLDEVKQLKKLQESCQSATERKRADEKKAA